MPLGTGVNVGSGDVVLDGVAAPPKRGTAPQLSVHVYCGQTAGWMKTPLCTEVDLGSGHIVLDGAPALRERGTAVPLFSADVYCGYGRPSQLLLSACYSILSQYLRDTFLKSILGKWKILFQGTFSQIVYSLYFAPKVHFATVRPAY